jgi:hypothetical protein
LACFSLRHPARFHRRYVPIGKVAEARDLLLQEHRSGIAVVGQGLAKDFRLDAVDADSADSVSASHPIRTDPKASRKPQKSASFSGWSNRHWPRGFGTIRARF